MENERAAAEAAKRTKPRDRQRRIAGAKSTGATTRSNAVGILKRSTATIEALVKERIKEEEALELSRLLGAGRFATGLEFADILRRAILEMDRRKIRIADPLGPGTMRMAASQMIRWARQARGHWDERISDFMDQILVTQAKADSVAHEKFGRGVPLKPEDCCYGYFSKSLFWLDLATLADIVEVRGTFMPRGVDIDVRAEQTRARPMLDALLAEARRGNVVLHVPPETKDCLIRAYGELPDNIFARLFQGSMGMDEAVYELRHVIRLLGAFLPPPKTPPAADPKAGSCDDGRNGSPQIEAEIVAGGPPIVSLEQPKVVGEPEEKDRATHLTKPKSLRPWPESYIDNGVEQPFEPTTMIDAIEIYNDWGMRPGNLQRWKTAKKDPLVAIGETLSGAQVFRRPEADACRRRTEDRQRARARNRAHHASKNA